METIKVYVATGRFDMILLTANGKLDLNGISLITAILL